MQRTEESKARSLLGLWLQEGIQFHYFRYLFGISYVLGSGLQVVGTPRWMRYNLSLQAAGREDQA